MMSRISEEQLDAELARLADVGVTDLNAARIPAEEGAEERTLDYLQSMVQSKPTE